MILVFTCIPYFGIVEWYNLFLSQKARMKMPLPLKTAQAISIG